MEPEILKLDPSKVESFIASEPRLKVYSFYLHDILRRRAHTLTDNEEKILASSSVDGQRDPRTPTAFCPTRTSRTRPSR